MEARATPHDASVVSRYAWLFGLLLAVPLIGFGVAEAIRTHFNSELRSVLQKQYPSATQEQLAQITVDRVCEDATDLYTLDLKTIIVAHWETFAPLFGGNKGRFEMNMDTLNKARRVDAHAKPIPPAEVEEISNSYAWLHARLDSIPKLL